MQREKTRYGHQNVKVLVEGREIVRAQARLPTLLAAFVYNLRGVTLLLKRITFFEDGLYAEAE